MSLRARLFLLLGGLVALLVGAQWWWVRSLAGELSAEVGAVAFWVGNSVASALVAPPGAAPPGEVPETCADGPCKEKVVSRVEVIRWRGGEGGEAPTPDTLATLRQEIESTAPEAPPGSLSYSFELGDAADPSGATGAHEEGAHRILVRLERAPEDLHVLALEGPHLERRIPIPEGGFRERLDRFSRRQVLGALALLAVGLVLAGAVSYRVTAPLARLAEAARRLGRGELGARVGVTASGEVGETLAAFDAMSARLAELDAKNRELASREQLSEIGEIARGLAHSLRNPLNALGLTVDELAATTAGGTAAQLAEGARRQIRRVDRSIRDFLALASEGRGKVEGVDVAALVRDVALEALQDARGRVRVDVEGAVEPAPLAAVEPELRAVVQALVVNAIEASREGGTVAIRLEPDAERLAVVVEDRGAGLPEAVRRRLFTPHLSTKPNGSGMGLFLAHRIATSRYGGSLALEDRQGGGTRARLELGARQGEADDG